MCQVMNAEGYFILYCDYTFDMGYASFPEIQKLRVPYTTEKSLKTILVACDNIKTRDEHLV